MTATTSTAIVAFGIVIEGLSEEILVLNVVFPLISAFVVLVKLCRYATEFLILVIYWYFLYW